MRKHASVAVVAAALSLGSAAALAHAALDHAEPRVGSKVQSAPAQLRLWYSEAVAKAGSAVKVVDRAGKRVDKDDIRVDATDQTLLEVSLKPLPPGT